MYNKKQSLLSTVQVRDKRPTHTQNARTIFMQMHVDAKAHLMRVISFVIRFHLWHSSPSSLNKKEDKRQFLQTPLKMFLPTNKQPIGFWRCTVWCWCTDASH